MIGYVFNCVAIAVAGAIVGFMLCAILHKPTETPISYPCFACMIPER